MAQEKIKEILDKIHNLYMEERGVYYRLKRYCEEILTIISEKLQSTEDETERRNYYMALSRLSHTSTKEVSYVEHHQDLMRKRNAAKVRRTEYENALNNAIRQIEMDLSSIID